MRWLVVEPGPDFSVQDVCVGWTEALQAAGEHVATFNLADRIRFYSSALMETEDGLYRRMLTGPVAIEHAVNGVYSAVMQVRPHILFVVSSFFLPTRLLDIVRDAGVRVVVCHTESPYEDERQRVVAAHADLNLLNDPTNLDSFKRVAPTEYFAHAYRPTVHFPGPADPDLACDMAFIGTGYPSRMQFLEAMDLDGLDVAIAGNWRELAVDSPLRAHLMHEEVDCLDNPQTAAVYRSMRCGLNLYRREKAPFQPEAGTEAGWSMGPREVEQAACGAFFLRDPRGEGDEVFHMLPTFGTPADASEKLRWWLAHDNQREKAAAAAREAVAERTFDSHARRLLRLLDKE